MNDLAGSRVYTQVRTAADDGSDPNYARTSSIEDAQGGTSRPSKFNHPVVPRATTRHAEGKMMVEDTGFEPVASAMRMPRSPN